MKSKHEHGYFVDPANPTHPVHMRIVWGEHKGWRRISRRDAAGLLRGAEPATVPEEPEGEPMPEETMAEPLQHPAAPEIAEPPTLPPLPSYVFELPRAIVHAAQHAPAPMPSIRDQERRASAKGRLQDAVLRAGQTALNEQMRYELALQALNGNVEAMAGFEPEARIRRLSVAELAHQIVTDRRTAERRMLHAYAVLARMSALIDQAAGPAIDDAADAGIREIERWRTDGTRDYVGPTELRGVCAGEPP